MAALYVPGFSIFTSKTLRRRPVTVFAGATFAPSGPITCSASRRSGWWSISNKPSETAASTVTQASLLSTIVLEGTIQPRWAWAFMARPARARASSGLLNCLNMMCALWFELDDDIAEFFLAFGRHGLGRLQRPLERHAHQFASTRFARRFHHHLVFSGRQLVERGLGAEESERMFARRTRGAADAVDGHGQVAAALAPPLTHVLQPFLACLVLLFHVIQHRQVADHLLIGRFQPCRHVGTVILRHVQLRDFKLEGQVGRHRRRTDQGKAKRQGVA